MVSNKDKIISFIELMGNDELEEIVFYIESNFSLKKNNNIDKNSFENILEEDTDEIDIKMINDMKNLNDDTTYSEIEVKKILGL